MIGNAVHVMRITTAEIEETAPEKQGKGVYPEGRIKGKKARALKLIDDHRSEIPRATAQSEIEKIQDLGCSALRNVVSGS